VIERPRKRSNKSAPTSGNGMGLPGPLPAGLGTAMRGPGPRMSPRQKQRLLRFLLVLGVGGTLALGILLRGHAPNPPFRIQVAGTHQTVPVGTTLDDLVRRFSLKPPSGDLLDVEGKVLTKEAFAGRVLVNGVAVRGNTAVSEGDVITVQPGKDRTEKIVRKVVKVPGGEIPNPQFFLGKASGVQIIRTGKISGKFVSSVFKPTGSFKPPKAVALTFDDGPSPTNTRKLLRVLQRFGVKATFFVIGRSASFHPDIVKAELAAGMEVANHSWSHPYLTPFRSLSSRVIRKEIELTQGELLSLGASSGLFRPPGGTFSTRVVDLAKESDTRLVMWSIDPKDWQSGRTSRDIAQAVLSKITPGAIVILHDGGGDQSATIGALPAIIRGIRAKGLQLVTIGEGSNL
jgi:peptidoglycan/xylan/chitin deacetylase (PgdA/CDA1 family)/sulfur carrier protein ThiS